jgi:hypothetical protein
MQMEDYYKMNVEEIRCVVVDYIVDKLLLNCCLAQDTE